MTIVIKNLFAASLAFITLSTNASLIDFTASGDGNIAAGWTHEELNELDFINDPAANFFKIIFTQGKAGEFITQLSFDLRAGTDADAYFDPSDGNADPSIKAVGDVSGKGFGPIIGNATDGLSSSDVSFSLDESSGINPILSIFFSAGSFMAGDILSFGIDIDELDGNLTDISGGLLGTHRVGIQANIGGSCLADLATAFQNDNRKSSSAQLEFCTPQQLTKANVPIPHSSFLLIIGLFALSQSRKRMPEEDTTNALA